MNKYYEGQSKIQITKQSPSLRLTPRTTIEATKGKIR